MIKLKAPLGVIACSFAGVEYAVKKRFVEVEEAAVEALREHGFLGVSEADPVEPEPAAPAAVVVPNAAA